MAIRLTASQIENFDNEPELKSQLVLADVIAVEWQGKKIALWKRPLAEVNLADIRVMTFPVSSEREIGQLQAIVDRLKHGDSPTA